MIFNRVHGGATPAFTASFNNAWSGIQTGGGEAALAIFESGTLTVPTASNRLFDLMLVGGGKNGSNAYFDGLDASYQYHVLKAGNGGNGGNIVTVTGIAIPTGSHAITIGEANGETTVTIGGTTYSTASGSHAAGGSGELNDWGTNYPAKEGKDGEYAFGASGSVPLLSSVSYGGNAYNLNSGKFGAGGGGGFFGNGNVDGGATNGGQGGKWANGYPGTFFGAGGGGGGLVQGTQTPYAGGTGFRGILLMRTHPTT